jgi:hypothetical protein
MGYKIIDSSQIEKIEMEDCDVEVIMPFISSAKALKTVEQLINRAELPCNMICIYDENREGFVSIINRAFKSSKSPYFVYLAEDAFAGRAWLKNAMYSIQALDGGLLAFNDGKWFGELAAFGLVSRKWACQNYSGNLFFPKYNSHFADVELSLIARYQNKLVYHPDALLVEIDYDKENKPVNKFDKLLFKNRKINGFDNQVASEKLLKAFE